MCVKMHFVSVEADTMWVTETERTVASRAPCGRRTHLAMALASEEQAKISRNVSGVTVQAPLGADGARSRW